MAKQSFSSVLKDLLISQGIDSGVHYTNEEMLKINLTQLEKEVKIIKEAYRKTINDYIDGDKKSFDQANEAWHNLGLVIQVHETIVSTYNEINRSIWK